MTGAVPMPEVHTRANLEMPHGAMVTSVLATVLERRYLEAARFENFRLLAADFDDAIPLLGEVLGIDSVVDEDPPEDAMARVLAACHSPGSSFVMVLFGDGTRQRLYYGVRRCAGGQSIEIARAGMLGALRAQIPGLKIGRLRPLAHDGHIELAAFIAEAGFFASMTGIPSLGRSGTSGEQRTLDQLVAAVGTARHALMIVAEPLPVADVETAMTACRTLMSEMHPQISRSVQRGRSDSTTVTETETALLNSFTESVPALAHAAAFALGPAVAATTMAATLFSRSLSAHHVSSRTIGTSRNEAFSDSGTLTMLDAEARYCNQLLERNHERLTGARGIGWWRTAVYLAADTEDTLTTAERTLRSAATGDVTQLESIRAQRAAPHQLREAMQRGRQLRLQPITGRIRHPLGPAQENLATCVSSSELAVLTAPPVTDIPGLMRHERSRFSLTVPRFDGASVNLGSISDGVHDFDLPVKLSARNLNEHVLVVGMPGSGKTNSCMRLLTEAYEQFGVPFLVIEPAKTEYRRLALRPSLRDNLRVFTIGGNEGLPLRLNPLRPVSGMPLLGHIDLLKAVFNASFSMFPGMPQILEQALIEVYEQRGWNLFTDTNNVLEGRYTADEQDAMLPTLGNLMHQVEIVLSSRGYGEEVRRNLGAALVSRLNGLRLGSKGLVLDTRRSTPLEDLFERPAIVELNNLRDDEEKSFVMALLFALLGQYCEARQRHLPLGRREKLQHITLIEEAHRLLAATPRAGAEAADAAGKGVALFTGMLAELRALGEGFVVAEQIPTKLAPDVLKNTNLKIVHRLTAPTDCAVISESINLLPSQARALIGLQTGMAVVHGLATPGEVTADAVRVRVAAAKAPPVTALSDIAAPPGPAVVQSLQRHGGCHACNAPCRYFPQIERSLRGADDLEFRDLAEGLLEGRSELLPSRFSRWCESGGRKVLTRGQLFCAFVHAAEAWLDKVLRARGDVARAPGASRSLRPIDLLYAHRLSKDFGTLARVLTAGDCNSNDFAARLLGPSVALTERLNLLVTNGDAGLPGCVRCPARCKALPYVATRSSDRLVAEFALLLPRGTIDAFGRGNRVAPRWEAIRQALCRENPALPGSHEITGSTAFRYCLVVHVPIPVEAEVFRHEILERVLAEEL